MSSRTVSTSISSAIKKRNLKDLERVLAQGEVEENNLAVPELLMEWPVPEVFALAGRHLAGRTWIRTFNTALEAGREELADGMIGATVDFPLHKKRLAQDVHFALIEAIGEGKLKAVAALERRGATLQGILDREFQPPLTRAALHDQAQMLTHLLPQVRDQEARDDALKQAVQMGHRAAAEVLWEVGSAAGRTEALLLAAKETGSWVKAGTYDTFAALLTQWPETTPLPDDSIRWAATNTCEHALNVRNDACALAMIPWVEPGASTRLLALALRLERSDLAPALMPAANLDEVRDLLIRDRPPRWDAVNELALLAPPETRAAWLKDKRNHGKLDRVLASDRAQQAQAIEAPSRPRRRPRS